MDEILKFIADLFIGNGIIIAVGAFVVGAIIKTSLTFIPKKFIPLICGILGMILAILIPNILEGYDLVSKAVCGLALGWAATGGYETIKNLTRKDK